MLLTVGAVADASSHLHRGPHELAIVPLVALTGSVAWRHVTPWITTALAVSAFIAFQLASGYNGGGAFEVAAIAFELLRARPAHGAPRAPAGRDHRVRLLAGRSRRDHLLPARRFGRSSARIVGLGRRLTVRGRTDVWRRAERSRRSSSRTRRGSRAAQEARAGRAATEERNRMARELHDVIAHGVSVMVLQSSGARGIAGSDLERARGGFARCREGGA